jgi:hypothetical protein
MTFSRSRFQPTEATGLTCPECGQPLTFTRSCQRAMLACDACGASFDPARFLDQLDDTFEEIYAYIPLDRM